MDITNNSINTIKIFADAKNFDSPRDSTTESTIKFRQGDYVVVDVVLQTNNKLADLTNIVSVNLEILDIGSINMPSPRDVKLLIQQTIQTDDINKNLTTEDIENGDAHVSFKLDKSNTSIENSDKWLKIYTYDSSGNRTTFSQGWIFVEESVGDDITSQTIENELYITKSEADSKYFLKDSNLNDSLDVSEIRNNIEVYSIDEIDGNLSEISTAITSLNSSIDSIDNKIYELQGQLHITEGTITLIDNSVLALSNNLESLSESKADTATTLSGYGITNAYTKTEIDTSLTSLETYIQTKADVDQLDIVNQSLKFEKSNSGCLYFGDGDSTLKISAIATLAESFVPEDLTFCFQCQSIDVDASEYGLISLHSIIANSTAYAVGVSVASQSSIMVSIGRFESASTSETGNAIFPVRYVLSFDRNITINDPIVISVSIDYENQNVSVNTYTNSDLTFELTQVTDSRIQFPSEFASVTTARIAHEKYTYPYTNSLGYRRKMKRLKVFDFILPENDDTDTDSIGYTINDYLNGLDEPPTLRISTADKKALISTFNNTYTVGTTQYIPNVGTVGNFTKTGTGYLAGTYDDHFKLQGDLYISNS